MLLVPAKPRDWGERSALPKPVGSYGHIWHSLTLVPGTVRKSAAHFTIDQEYLEIFDTLAQRLESSLLPRHTRSGFMNKAAQLWVNAMKAEYPDLKPIIESIQQRYESLRKGEISHRRSRVVRLNRNGSRPPSA
jgi:hypothetical protein